MGITKVVIAPAIHVGGDGSTPVIDSLSSDSTTSALSAKQGKVLKGLIDELDPGSGAVPAENITQDATHRFVTDTEKTTWNGKQNALGFTPVATDDARLSDARTPVAHQHAMTDVTGLTAALADKADSTTVTSGLAGKVDKEAGKGLSSNDFTSAEKSKLAGLSNYDDTALSDAVDTLGTTKADADSVYTKTEVDTALGEKAAIQTVAAPSAASTLAVADLNKILRKTGDLTIDTNANVAIPINSVFSLQQSGAGPVAIVPAEGVTLIPPYGISLESDGSLLLRGESDAVKGVKTDTNEWSFFGQAPAGAVSNNMDPVLISATPGAIRFFYNQKYLLDTSLEVAMIGDSQGTDLYADPSMEEQLATRFPNWVITNYCVSGQNCRNIDADGTNGYVNTAANITKAVADGNKVIIIVDTSNDSSPNEDGGVVPLEEWQSRLLNIKTVAEAAGALPLFFSTFPRSDAGTEKDNQRNMKDWMAAVLGNHVFNCYATLENPDSPDTMRPGYNANSDLIHYNATGIGKALAIAEGRLAHFFFTLPSQVKYYRVYSSETEGGAYTLHDTITDPLQTDFSGLDAGWYKVQVEYLDGTLSPMSRAVEVEAAAPSTSAAWNFSNTAAALTGYNNVVGGGLSASAPNNYNATWPDVATGSAYVLRNLPTDGTTALAKWGANYAGNNSGNNVGEAVNPMRHAWWSQNITWSGSTQNQLRIEGCTPGASYKLTFWCSRLAGSPENGVTVIVINNVTPGAGNEVNALGNTTPKVFTGIVADASGYITICIARKVGTSIFGFINALKIESE